jgi:hypothetical protein
LIFSTSPEFYSGTTQIIASQNGNNWTVIKSVEVSESSRFTNTLTSNPTDFVLGSVGPNRTFTITQEDISPTLPTPTTDNTDSTQTPTDGTSNGPVDTYFIATLTIAGSAAIALTAFGVYRKFRLKIVK